MSVVCFKPDRAFFSLAKASGFRSGFWVLGHFERIGAHRQDRSGFRGRKRFVKIAKKERLSVIMGEMNSVSLVLSQPTRQRIQPRVGQRLGGLKAVRSVKQRVGPPNIQEISVGHDRDLIANR